MVTFLLPLLVFSLVVTPGVSAPRQQSSLAEKPASSAAFHPDEQTEAASAEMQSLMRAMSGRWAIELKFEPTSEMPGGSQGKGEELWRPIAGGLAFSDEEKIELPQGTIRLLGLIWWDRASKEFKGMECINQNPHACDVKGAASGEVSVQWDGKQLTLEQPQSSAAGKKALWHETFSEITATSFVQVGETWEPGGQHRKVVTVHGTKVSE